MIVPDSPHNSNSSNVSLSEAPATAAHGDGSAYEFPPDWAPTEAPPMADDWQPETPSGHQNVKGGRLYARPVANSGSLEFAKGLERSGNPLQATGNYAVHCPSEPRSAGLPSGERLAVAVLQAAIADPSRPKGRQAVVVGCARETPVKGLSMGHISPPQCKRLRIVQSEAVQNV